MYTEGLCSGGRGDVFWKQNGPEMSFKQREGGQAIWLSVLVSGTSCLYLLSVLVISAGYKCWLSVLVSGTDCLNWVSVLVISAGCLCWCIGAGYRFW